MLKKLLCGLHHEGKDYNVANFEELTGKQQNYLMRFDDILELKEKYSNDPQKLKEELSFLNLRSHLPVILSDLTSDLQNDIGELYPKKSSEFIYELPIEDIYFLLINIRELSFGHMLPLKVTCDVCGTVQIGKKGAGIFLELDKLEYKRVSPETSRKEIVTHKDHKIVLKRRGLKEALQLENIFKDHPKDMYTYTLLLAIESIDGKKPTTEILESLTAKENNLIKEEVDKMNIEIDLNFEHICEKCKEELIYPLPILDPFFFSPSKIHTQGSPKSLYNTD